MRIFGFTVLRTSMYVRRLERIEKHAREEGLWNIVELLKKKNKIYISPVRLKGDGHVLNDSVFFSRGNKSCVCIKPKDK